MSKIAKGKWSKATSRFFIGIGNDNQPVTTKMTSINFARPLKPITNHLVAKGKNCTNNTMANKAK